MKRRIRIWQAVGFAVTSVGGTLLHFLYEWLKKPVWIAPFSGVNESTWEHMKILFWPAFIFAIIESIYFRKYKNFWCIKLRGITIALILIPTLFYTFNGAIGKMPTWFNISIFFVSAAIAFIYELRLFNSSDLNCKSERIALTVLILLAIIFIAFTFKPPMLSIFKDPLSNTFGI